LATACRAWCVTPWWMDGSVTRRKTEKIAACGGAHRRVGAAEGCDLLIFAYRVTNRNLVIQRPEAPRKNYPPIPRTAKANQNQLNVLPTDISLRMTPPPNHEEKSYQPLRKF
jgi:hypothetical protein